MSKKRIFAGLLSLLAFSAVVGAGFASASSAPTKEPAVVQDADSVDHRCPPDCNAADKADEGSEAPGIEDSAESAVSTDSPDSKEAPEGTEAPGESDGPGGHEDPAGNVDHQFEGQE